MSLKGGYVTWTAVPLIKLKNIYSSGSGPKTGILALLPLLDCVGDEMSVLTSPWRYPPRLERLASAWSMSLYKEVMSRLWKQEAQPGNEEESRPDHAVEMFGLSDHGILNLYHENKHF